MAKTATKKSSKKPEQSEQVEINNNSTQAETPKMTKAEAATYLSVSERAIERYTKKGLLHPEYEEKSKGGKALFLVSELDEVKRQMTEQAQQTQVPVSSENKEKSKAIEKRENQSLNREGIKEILAAIAQAQMQVVPLINKSFLDKREAVLLTGLTLKFITNAIKNNELKAHKIGRSVKIHRTDLETFCDNLFSKS